MSDALDSLLRPSSVAVVGASDEPFTFSGATIHNLRAHGFDGAIYPVNPRRDTVQGLTCYPSVLDIPAEIDTAVITVPAAAALRVLEECETRGIRSATVVSSGFGEGGAGAEGAENATRLKAFIKRAGIRILGPNTAGLINLFDGYVPRAAVNHITGEGLRTGSIALLTQSGACSNIVFNRAQRHGVGIGLMCATGDDEDITVWELAGHIVRDDRVKVIMVITESIGDPVLIRDVATESRRRGKPIVHLRLGTSELGSAVAETHSGSIAGDAEVARQAFRQWGIIDVDDFDELWETARLFEAWGVPTEPTGSLGVFAFSGGEAALLADQASARGLRLPPPSEEFGACVREHMAYAKAANPFDATGELVGRPEKLRSILTSFVTSNDFSEVLIATPVYRAEAARRLLPQLTDIFADAEFARHRIVFSMWPVGEFTAEQQRLLEATGAPVIAASPRAVGAIGHYQRYRDPVRLGSADKEKPRSDIPLGELFASDRYADIRGALEGMGIPFVPLRLVHSADEARSAAADLGLPVAMKANVPSTLHKAAAGVVRIGVGSFDQVDQVFTELQTRGRELNGDGVTVEGTAHGSLQAIAGGRRDPHFGPVVLFGVGGSAADFMKDSAVALCDGLDEDGVRALLADTRLGSYLLASYPNTVMTITQIVMRLADLLTAGPRVAEVDINPVFIDTTRDCAVCVDGRVLLRHPPDGEEKGTH